jgi:hypothetical protein
MTAFGRPDRRARVHSQNLPDARDIAGIVSVPQMLRHFGWGIRRRNRADYGLCRGNSKGTVAFTERLWRCHRCNEGGNVFSLVRGVQRCDFLDALRYVAHLGGIWLEDSKCADRHEIEDRERRRERIEKAAQALGQIERTLRLQHLERIRDVECKRFRVSERLADLLRGGRERFRGESESLWATLKAAHSLLETDLAAYTLLAFGSAVERARYVLHSDLRDEILAGIRSVGGVRTEGGDWVQVLQ